MSAKPQKKPTKSSAANADPPQTDLMLYQTEDGKTRLEVRLENETVWLSQNQMADLFQTTKQNVSLHIQNIFDERELERTATVKESLTVQQEGGRSVQRRVEYYNLDVIISTGYRVKSHRGTQFRIWATQRLREYIVKGFALDDERLKKGGGDHFDELLERIREIRASERNFYQKIREIYTTSDDYDPHAAITLDFFAMAQNKLHWAIHGHTAAELITERADATKPNMGLTAWSGVKVRKQDIHTAKNYLTKTEMELLNLIVNQYLEFAEFQARTRKIMYMRDWVKKLDDFLRLNDREVLKGFGNISAQLAKENADRQFAKFDDTRRKIADAQAAEEFAKEVDELQSKAKELGNTPTQETKNQERREKP